MFTTKWGPDSTAEDSTAEDPTTELCLCTALRRSFSQNTDSTAELEKNADSTAEFK